MKGYSERMNKMKKKLIISISVIAIFFIIGITGGIALSNLGGMGLTSGIMLKTDNNTCFLISHNSPIRLSDMSGKEDRFGNFESGDKVLVLHTGVNESYPASTGVYFCIKTGKGNEADIPANVTDSLKELGWIKKDGTEPQNEKLVFSEKYLRTSFSFDGDENTVFPYTVTINTYEELTAYYENNKENFYLDDEFKDTIKEYNREFFHNNTLIISVLEEGSGSVSHTVEKIEKNGDEIYVHIKRNVPEVGTCDMAYHHIFTAVEKSQTRNCNVKLFVDGKDTSKKWERVFMQKDFANLSLYLPENWDYEEFTGTEGEYFGISFFNINAPESTFSLEFTYGFGVCGTGLHTEDITVNGYKAHKGIYDGNPTFDYILFEDTPGFYVIKNNTDGKWWQEYGQELNEILETIKIAEGIIFREEALAIAQKNANGENKKQYNEYDFKTGEWTFVFETSETSQTVKIDKDGNKV